MPKRSDDWYRETSKDPRYCVICKEYYAFKEWNVHPHNPNRKGQSLINRLIRAVTSLFTRTQV